MNMRKFLKDNRVGVKAARITALAFVLAALAGAIIPSLLSKDKPSKVVEQVSQEGNNIYQESGNIIVNPPEKPLLALNDMSDTPSAFHDSVENIAADYKIELKSTKKYLNRFYKILDFTLSNQSSRGIIVVHKLELEVLNVRPLKTTSFPEGPAMPFSEFVYEVHLFPNKKRYKVTDQKFKYGPGDIDEFIIKTKSDPGYLYELILKVFHYDIESPTDQKVTKSVIHKIGFPLELDLRALLESAISVDFFLYDPYAIQKFIVAKPDNKDTTWIKFYDFSSALMGKKLRYIFHKDNKNIVEKADLPTGCYVLVDNMPFLKQKEINAAEYVNSGQFIIIDEKIVIQHIGYFEGQVLEEQETVLKYRDYFNQSFQVSE
jgi:hypothetical protein